MEEIEKFVLSMEEKVTELDAQMQEHVKALNAKMDEIKTLIQQKKISIDNAKNGIDGRIWRVGDVVLSDGTIVNVDEVKDMEDEDVEKAEGVVCAVKQEGKIAYILNAKQVVFDITDREFRRIVQKDDKEALEEYEKQLGNNLLKFRDGWKLPGFKLLAKIAANREIINQSLSELNTRQIDSPGEYILARDKSNNYLIGYNGEKYENYQRAPLIWNKTLPVYEIHNQ